MRQGDNLAPTLFYMFVNDLAYRIKALNAGIDVNNDHISILLYADDIALISDSPDNLQCQVNELHSWSEEWMLNVNLDKILFVHFRKKGIPTTEQNIMFGTDEILRVNQYKYIGLIPRLHSDCQGTS